jgi:hypothetical protein
MNWLHHLNAVFWKQNEWKLREIVQDFDTENVLMGKKIVLSLTFVTS